MFQRFGIGTRIGIGFGVVVLLIAVVALSAVFGVGGLVEGTHEITAAESLQVEMMQREIDHLAWANKLGAIFTDDTVDEVQVQTDPHKCGFGKWYYGEGRRQAEELLPELRTPLDAIEQFHNDLHASAVAVDQAYAAGDREEALAI